MIEGAPSSTSDEVRMPLLHLPIKLLRGESMRRADLLDAPIEHIIAEGRIFLAAFSLGAICLDSDLLASRDTGAFQVLVAYAGFAIALVAIGIWKFPRQPAGHILHCIDIAFLLSLSALSEARASPVLTFFTFFILLAASLRWDWQAVIATAVVITVAFWGTVFAQAVSAGGSPKVSPRLGIVRGVYVLITGAMLAFYSAERERRREQLTKLTEWPGPDPSQVDGPSLANLLAHCARALEVPRVLVLWEESEEPFVNIVFWQNHTYKHTREMSGAFGGFVRSQQHAGAAFWTPDAGSTFAVLPDGPVHLQAPILDEGLIKTFTIRSVASAPFVGSSCRGRIFILDRDSWSDFQLQLIQIMASRLANALDRQMLQNQAKDAAADRERARLTRDLHDGVLQSLTAAGLQIKILADGESRETRERLELVRQVLVGEQRRVRDFVRKTPPEADSEAEVPLSTSLRNILVETAQHWNCTTSLTVDPPEATVLPRMCVHLSLMLAEAVANAVRHGKASSVRVSIHKTHQALAVHVCDDGRGFNGATFDRSDKDLTEAGLGPFSLRDRVHELGGLLGVKSSPTGVELQIQLPLT